VSGFTREPLSADDALALEECIAAGGVALFPADTVYGLACDPGCADAIARLYGLKGRVAGKPSAVLFASIAAASPVLDSLPAPTAAAARALLPGPVTLLLPNPSRRYALACDPTGESPAAPLGIRVPSWPDRLSALAAVLTPLMQSSANLAGEPPALTLADVPATIRRRADIVIDGGELPGVASTVIDLEPVAGDRRWRIIRRGALSEEAVAATLSAALVQVA
jgi:L-threonylcarbamoyladenylate synthase